jgi:hypothetical protein
VTYSDGAWHHLLVRRNGNTFDLYKDGVVKATSSDSSVINNSAPTTIGNSLNGSMSDIRIYNKALSNAEISQLYNATKP